MKYIKSQKIIRDSLKELNDIVVPTMGAKGLLAGIYEEMDRPTLTDDGVTVVKQCRKMDGWGQMIASGAIEAAHNTEKVAYDGTTLTVMMTYELFNLGYGMIRRGRHPQNVARMIEKEVSQVIKELASDSMKVTNKKMVKDVATISTKIPELGDIIADAYKVAGKNMNIMIEHDREKDGISIEHEKGYGIDSGYYADVMKAFCNTGGDITEYQNARVAILKEGIMNQTLIGKFFGSIPADEVHTPVVFIVDPAFNPEALRIIIETVVKNELVCQFIFLNEPQKDDVFSDLAAITNGVIQDAAGGIKEYTWDMCGIAKSIRIEKDKALIIGDGDASDRIREYEKTLNKKKFQNSESVRIITERRLSSLTNGITKIKVGVPTITEFKTMKLKLDDGIGAVREAFKRGVQLGGGKAMYLLAPKHPLLKRILRKPLIQICKNAGIRVNVRRLKDNFTGIDVTTGKYINLVDTGILDSSASIEEALKNASSIACNYLRTYILIKERD